MNLMLGRMRRSLLRSVIAVFLIIVAISGWIIAARPLSMLLDQVQTAQVESQPISELGIKDVSGGMIRIDGLLMSIAMPNNRPLPMTMTTDAKGRFGLTVKEKRMVLGTVIESDGGSVVRPEPGDRAIFRISHSILSWPTPLDINFMSGHSPSWKRHMYYRLLWRKPGGTELDMLWRYEQYFYGKDGWASGFMTRQGSTGLLRASIRP